VTLAYSPNAAALLTLVAAALLTALIVPAVRRLGLRWGLVDAPDPRKQHSLPMVRLGGVGIVAGFSLALAITWGAGGFLNRINFPDAIDADFSGMNTPGMPQVWRPVTTSASVTARFAAVVRIQPTATTSMRS